MYGTVILKSFLNLLVPIVLGMDVACCLCPSLIRLSLLSVFMPHNGATCAMCGTSMYPEPDAGYTVPATFLPALAHSEADDAPEVEDFFGKMAVDLCWTCDEQATEMLAEGETPLFECDARRLNTPDGMGVVMADASDEDEITQSMVADSVIVVKMADRGDAEHILDARISTARAIVYTARDLDIPVPV